MTACLSFIRLLKEVDMNLKVLKGFMSKGGAAGGFVRFPTKKQRLTVCEYKRLRSAIILYIIPNQMSPSQ